MNLRQKMRSSALEYCRVFRLFDPYLAGSLVNEFYTVDSNIEIVIYEQDKEYVSNFLKSNYDQIALTEERKEKYWILSFTDIYHTNQLVRITVIGKDPEERDKDLVKPAFELFGPIANEPSESEDSNV